MLRRLAILALALGGAASAAPPLDNAAKRQLDLTQTEARSAAVRRARLGIEAEAALRRAERAGRALVHVAARVQESERRLTATERRLATYERERRAARARLAARQEEVVGLLATLQTLSRRPAALALVQPASAADVAHVRMALDALTPELNARTRALRAEVAQAEAIVARLAAERGRQAAAQAALEADRAQLARIEVAQRQAGARLSAQAVAEAERSAALAVSARSLRDLVARTTRTAFAAAPVTMRLLPPVAGELRQEFGSANELGLHAQGVTLAARGGAQVVAPAAGRIAFAGPFRTYGRIVIIEHGGGWLSLMSGLAATTRRAGDIVPEGMPVGRMGGEEAQLYLELREDGIPVDPAPYLAPAGQTPRSLPPTSGTSTRR